MHQTQTFEFGDVMINNQICCEIFEEKNIDYHQYRLSDFGCSNDRTCCRTFGSSDEDYACCTLQDFRSFLCLSFRHDVLKMVDIVVQKGTKCDTQYGGYI
ncbi:unnamed protein product [Adineta steineri]|uniref:Uncharacterized protein n=1 Tax=Adineta steineri TaxID=433720 RepID=A0A813Y701_9BILA|nr:unnamed protein product [Adineta steineri]CAF3655904.1 unnamed protein product [Adineta steineri]